MGLRARPRYLLGLGSGLLLVVLGASTAANAQSFDENGPPGEQQNRFNRLAGANAPTPRPVAHTVTDGYKPRDEDRAHRGLFFRTRVGADIVFQSYVDPEGGQLAIGEALELNPAIGARVADQWILFADAFLAYATGTYGGGHVNAPPVTYGGIGPGVLHFFQPSNAWVSASFLAYGARLRGLTAAERAYNPDVPGDMSERLTGVLSRLSVGREWWLAPKVSAGVSFTLSYGRSRQSLGTDAGTTWVSTTMTGLMFSATYN